MWQKSAAGRRRTTIDRPGTAPELNAYMKGKVPKGEVRRSAACRSVEVPLATQGCLAAPNEQQSAGRMYALCGSFWVHTAPALPAACLLTT